MKNRRYIILAATLPLAVVSCGPMGKYSEIKEVNNNLYSTFEHSDRDSSTALVSWNDFFSDRKLKDLITEVLERNIDIKVAHEKVLQAEASLSQSRAAYAPSLNVTPGITGKFSNSEATTFKWDVTATSSWEIDIFGRMANNKKKAKVNVELMKDYEQAVKVQMVSSVANTYYTLLMIDAELAAAREMEKTWEKTLKTIHTLKREGFADEVAVNQYEATFADIRSKVVNLESLIHKYENAMSILLGRTPGTIERGLLNEQKVPERFNLGVPVQMLQLRPDVRAAQRNVEVAFYTTKAAWYNFFPSLTISGNGTLTDLISQSPLPLSILGNLSAGLTAPIFNYGANRAKLRIAESQQRQAKLSFDKTLLSAGGEVCNAFGALNSCRNKASYYENQVNALYKARRDTELLMQNSESKTYLDVLQAHNSLFSALFNMIENKAAECQAAVNLYAALGGGGF